MSDYGRVRRGDEDQLKRVVANMVLTLDSSRVLQFNISTKQYNLLQGPTSVGVWASYDWMHYNGQGVFSGECGDGR